MERERGGFRLQRPGRQRRRRAEQTPGEPHEGEPQDRDAERLVPGQQRELFQVRGRIVGEFRQHVLDDDQRHHQPVQQLSERIVAVAGRAVGHEAREVDEVVGRGLPGVDVVPDVWIELEERLPFCGWDLDAVGVAADGESDGYRQI